MGNLIDWIVCSADDDDEFDELYDSGDSSNSGDFPFSNIELTTCHKYDCVLVFDQGSRIEQWKYSQYQASIQYDYLNLLDASLISERKSRFPHHGANFASCYDTMTVHKSIHSLNNPSSSTHPSSIQNKYEYQPLLDCIDLNIIFKTIIICPQKYYILYFQHLSDSLLKHRGSISDFIP